MAQEKPRASRARATKDTEAAAKPKPAAKPRAKSTASAAPKAKTTAKTTAKTRAKGTSAAKPKANGRTRAPSPSETEIATLAYLMWERGEPGDADDHWLRAEAELVTA